MEKNSEPITQMYTYKNKFQSFAAPTLHHCIASPPRKDKQELHS